MFAGFSCKQDPLHNLRGLAQNENAGPLFKNGEFQDTAEH